MSTGLPPQTLEAERAVLGAVLVGSRQLEDAAGILRGADFYQPRHELIWDACLSVARDGRPVDAVSVLAALGPDLERAGGGVYLSDLTGADVSPNPGQLMHYAAQVVDAALRRRLIGAGLRVVQYAEQAGSAVDAVGLAQRAVEDAASTVSTDDAGMAVGDGLEAAITWLETSQVGAETPWSELNDRTNGLLAGQMVTVGARPGHGKSLVVKDVALFTALRGRPAHVATLEMSRNEYLTRILSGLAGVDLGRMLRRDMNDHEWAKIADATKVVRDLPLVLDDRPHQTMAQIRAAARKTARRYGGQLGVLAIDYAQLVTPESTRAPRQEQVSQISRDTKLLAKELECPTLLAAQLSRKGADRSSHVPLVTDLRESGSLEQDSDQVWLLHRPDQYVEERFGEVDVIVGKNRNGPAPVTVSLAFQGHYARIVTMV